jgi:photosystem II stability/assembly factor-like uncharacterized protein
MKNFFTLLGIACLTMLMNVNIVNAQSQWIQVNSGTNETINSIDIFDNNRLIAVTFGGTTIISDDNAETWTENYVTYESLTSIDAHGGSAIAVSDYGLILHSADYGDTWSLAENTGIRLRCAEFWDQDRAFVSGDDEIVLESKNNMATWNYIPYIVGNGFWMRDISFIDEMNGFVVGDGGTAFKTPNAGYGWFKIDTKTTENLKSITFPTADTGYICGNGSTLLKTTDGGLSWENIVSTNYGDFRGTIFFSTQEGYLCGTDGLILHTTDGGASWVQEESGVSTHLSMFCYIESTQRLVLIGHNGVLMYKDLTVSTDDITSEKDSGPVTLYPNPAKNTVCFQFIEPPKTQYEVHICNSNGEILVKKMLSPFQKDLSLDIENYPAGTYHFCIINKSKTIQSGTFIKQ